MRIGRVDTVTLAIPYPYDGPRFNVAGKDWNTVDMLLVRVETETGLVGWGEASGHGSVPATRAAGAGSELDLAEPRLEQDLRTGGADFRVVAECARQRSEPASHLSRDGLAILVRAEAVDSVVHHSQVGNRPADDQHR